jgi:hypothetical protein
MLTLPYLQFIEGLVLLADASPLLFAFKRNVLHAVPHSPALCPAFEHLTALVR